MLNKKQQQIREFVKYTKINSQREILVEFVIMMKKIAREQNLN